MSGLIPCIALWKNRAVHPAYARRTTSSPKRGSAAACAWMSQPARRYTWPPPPAIFNLGFCCLERERFAWRARSLPDLPRTRPEVSRESAGSGRISKLPSPAKRAGHRWPSSLGIALVFHSYRSATIGSTREARRRRGRSRSRRGRCRKSW